MKKVIVASTNPVKVVVAKRAFADVFPDETFEFVAVPSESGVADQPFDEETQRGALNRLSFIQKLYPEADYWISQEGGIERKGENMSIVAWIVVMDSTGTIAQSSSASVRLPREITALVASGVELGTATDTFFEKQNSKQGISTIGYLTDGLISREDYYLQPAIIALSELKHASWFR